jgi:hypothetical protein
LAHENEYVRSWAIQLAAEGNQPSPDILRQFATMARQDQSPMVRLYLASALQRIPVDKRADILSGLLTHREDAGDQNLPLMLWYAAEPSVESDMSRALTMATDSPFSRLFPFTVQRIGATGTPDALRILAERLARTLDRGQQKELATAIAKIVQ